MGLRGADNCKTAHIMPGQEQVQQYRLFLPEGQEAEGHAGIPRHLQERKGAQEQPAPAHQDGAFRIS